MSLFKEKDEQIKSLFQKFNEDSDDEVAEISEADSINKDASFEQSKFSPEPETHNETVDENVKSESNPTLADSPEYLTTGSTDDENENEVSDGESSDCCIVINSDEESREVPTTRRMRTRQSAKKVIQDEIIMISSDCDEDATQITPISQKPAPETISQASQASQNVSIEDRDFTLRLRISGNYKQFLTTYRASLSEALKPLLQDLKSRGKTLLFTDNPEEILLHKSPLTLGLKPGTILNAIEVPLAGGSKEESIDPNAITIKLQDGNRKHKKDFTVLKDEPLSKLKEKYAKTYDLDPSVNIRLFFDGDLIDDTSTADDLGIEGDEVIDVML